MWNFIPSKENKKLTFAGGMPELPSRICFFFVCFSARSYLVAKVQYLGELSWG